MCVCVGACESCVFLCWDPTFHLFVFALLAAAAAAAAAPAASAVSCRQYHMVPQALKLYTLWQTRYNSSRAACLCEPLLAMRVLT